MRWPWSRRDIGPGGPTSEFDASGAAVIMSTYGDPNVEQILPTFQAYAEQAYSGNSVVFGAVLARMSLFSEATFCFQDLTDGRLYGSFETDGRKPGLSKLETPWPNATQGELFARAEQDLSLAGNFYVRDVGPYLERLRPDRVTIVSAIQHDAHGRPYREVIGYGYDRDATGRSTEFYDVDEVRHWSPIPDPVALFRGMSWLTPVRREIESDSGLTAYKVQYVEHAMTPNMIVKYDKQLKPDTIENIENRLQSRHGGVSNAYKTLVLDMGADTTVVGNTLEQANFTTVQAAGENRILIASGVPGIVIGSKEGLMAATYSNYAQAMRRFTDLTMWPNWRSFCAAMAPLVTVPNGSRLWFDTRNIAALQAGEKERADVLLVQAQAIASLVAAGATLDSAATAVNGYDLTDIEAAPKPTPPPMPPQLEKAPVPNGAHAMNGAQADG